MQPICSRQGTPRRTPDLGASHGCIADGAVDGDLSETPHDLKRIH